MELKTLYKVISGSSTEVEHIINVLAEDDWRPVAMSCSGKPIVMTVILENKIAEELKLTVSDAIVEETAANNVSDEVQ